MKSADGDLTGIHVLLVDDSLDALEIFGSYLRHVGAVVTLARNGAEALGYLEQARADIIVTDLSMRGMDGVEFVSRLRGYRSEATAPTPVIAVTAFPDNYLLESLQDLGFRAYLVKPVEPARLALEVRRLYDFLRNTDSGTTAAP